MTRQEMEERLVDFVAAVTKLVVAENKNTSIHHLNDQAIRSASSCALNYGEAQGAVSGKDFLNKTGIVLKELRETYINLRIIKKLNNNANGLQFDAVLKEADELQAIFYKTIMTARRNGKL